LEEEKPKPKSKFIIKVQELLDKYFYRIFNESHLLYTIIFFISAILIALISLIPNWGDLILFLATTISLAFIFLMFFGLIPKLNDFLFSTDKRFDRNKIFGFLIAFGISFVIILVYFLLGHSTQSSIQFLGWDLILPTIFIIIYFGWNIIQIFFLKVGFEDLSIKINNKVLTKFELSERKEYIAIAFLILGLAAPILMQIGTFYGFWSYFAPVNQGDPLDNLYLYIGWNVVVFIIIGITSWRLINLHLRSKKNETPNVFSSMFYIFIWLIIWYRVFSFTNALRGATQPTGTDVIMAILDVLLMVATAILVLKGLGDKVYTSRIFNVNNMPFFLFAFTFLYIEGQIIMITGGGSLPGFFTDRNQVNLISNFLMLIITVFFFIWYSEYVLERKGLIMRKRYNQEEVILIVSDFKKYLEDNEALDINKIGDKEFQDFLQVKKLKIKGLKPLETEPKKVQVEEKPFQEEKVETEKINEEKDSIEEEQEEENLNEEEME